MEINRYIKNICSIICTHANNELHLCTVSKEHKFTRKLFNTKIISLPGLPYGQHTWGAFSIFTPPVLSFNSNAAL